MRRNLFALLAIVTSVGLMATGCGSDDGDQEVKAAFIYVGPVGDAGWTWAHDQGRQFAADQTGVETACVEMVPEGTADFGNYVRDFIGQGYNVIFGTSFGYMDDMLALADEYPDVVFEHISGYKANDTNFGNTFGRMYEPRYLSGMVAGASTSSNLIGYVAAFPIPEVIRGINAFTLGVREVNPDAQVEVNWTSTWFDPAVEGDAAQALLDKGADVIAMHQDSTAAGQAAEAAGARWVSYNSDMSAFAPDAYLTAPVWNWGPRYVEIIEAAQAGTYTPGYYWGSMADGVVDLAPIAADVDSGVTDQVLAAKEAIIAGDLHPFTGPLYDQAGNLVLGAGETMDDGTMLGMSFFVDGVIGSTGAEAPAAPTTTTEPPDPRFTFEPVEGVPGVDDDEIAFAVIGIRTNNPLGTCILDCYLHGVEAYFAFRNAEGGLFGRELRVSEVLDDELFSNQIRALEVISADNVFGVFNATLIASGWGDLNDSGIPNFVWNIHATESANRTNLFGHFASMCATCTQRGVPYTVKIAGATKVASLGYGVSENSKVCAQSVAASIDLYSADIGAEMAYFNDSLGYGLPNGIAPEVTQMKELGVDFISTCMDLNAMKTMAQELARQGMGDVVLYHPNTYNHPFVAEAGDLFDGDFVTPQFMPFEADADNTMQTAFIDTMTELGRELSELAMIGWINADAAYTAILSAGTVFDQKSAIDALNSQTEYDAGGLIVPIDWSRQHVPPVEGEAANDYALECFAPVRMSEGALETVADPATPWFCWDNTTLDWDEPTQTVFGG